MIKMVIKRSVYYIYAYILMLLIPCFIRMEEEIGFSYSILSVGIYVLLVWFLKRYWTAFWKTKVWDKVILCLFSVFFLIALIMGRMLDEYGYLNIEEWGKLLAPFIGMPFLGMVLYHVYEAIDKKLPCSEQPGLCSKKENIVLILFLFVSWGIVLLGVYPGFFVYDAIDEIHEVITRQFTTHHPLLHVLYMGGIVQAGYKIFGSYNLGIFAFTLFQMSIFIVGIVYTANKMRSFGFHRYICRGMVIFMGVFPVFPMFVLCSCKDSMFALFVLLWVVTTYEWFNQKGKYSEIKWFLCSVMMCLLRNNAVYALLVTGLILILFKKMYSKKLLISLVLSIVISIFASKGMSFILNAEPAGHQEILTVPIQQLTRTYQLSREVFTEEEIEKLYEYLPEKYLERYRPKLSDGVKIGFRNEAYEEDSAGFFKLWISIGLKAPMSYMNAWLMTSYGYWYPDTVIDVYEGNNVFTFTYKDNSYFGFETEEPGYRESKFPIVNEFYRRLSLEVYKEKLPAVSQLFSPGFVLWVFIFMMVFMVRKRGKDSIMPYCFLLLVIATLLLGPTYLPRYVFFLWMVIPFMFADMCSTGR